MISLGFSVSIADGSNEGDDEHFPDNFMCLPPLQVQNKEKKILMFNKRVCFSE